MKEIKNVKLYVLFAYLFILFFADSANAVMGWSVLHFLCWI